MFALVAGMPLVARYSATGSNSLIQSEVEDSKVAESADQNLELFAAVAIDCEIAFSPIAQRIDDDHIAIELTIAGCHLQRGPPRA